MSAPTDVFELGSEHEQVVFANDSATGLRAIVAIHSTALGPALGGTRFYPYASTDDAIRDVLNLSRGMSYKAALAGLDLGGGKAVIIGDPATHKTEALLRAYGRFVQSLAGRYYTACDVGTNSCDMDQIARECDFVTGRTTAHGGAGDSSVLTAYGVFQGMRAAAEVAWGEPTLAGRTVGVAGVGKVGSHLVGHLVAGGATVVATDTYQPAVDRILRRTLRPSVVDVRRAPGPHSARRLRALRAGRRAHRRGRRSAERPDRRGGANNRRRTGIEKALRIATSCTRRTTRERRRTDPGR